MMNKTPVRSWLSILWLPFVVSLCACLPTQQRTSIPHELYTEIVKTVVVQLTQYAELTPSATTTLTSKPTSTSTPTPLPSPTEPSPTATWEFHDPGAVVAPILVYYNIADDATDNPAYQPGAVDNLPSQAFKQQMTALKDAGYSTISLRRLIRTIKSGADLPEKPVVITFDGMTSGIYTKAFPILKDLGYVGNIFITENFLGLEGMLNVPQIKDLREAGWAVGSRGKSGIDLTSDHSLLSDEIYGSRNDLETNLGMDIKIFSYPYGRTDDVVLSHVAEWGYDAAVGLALYNTSEHSIYNLYYLSRFEVKNDWNLEQFFSILPWKPEVLPASIPTNNTATP